MAIHNTVRMALPLDLNQMREINAFWNNDTVYHTFLDRRYINGLFQKSRQLSGGSHESIALVAFQTNTPQLTSFQWRTYYGQAFPASQQVFILTRVDYDSLVTVTSPDGTRLLYSDNYSGLTATLARIINSDDSFGNLYALFIPTQFTIGIGGGGGANGAARIPDNP